MALNYINLNCFQTVPHQPEQCNQPCENGGTCWDGYGYCMCIRGYTGEYCEIESKCSDIQGAKLGNTVR